MAAEYPTVRKTERTSVNQREIVADAIATATREDATQGPEPASTDKTKSSRARRGMRVVSPDAIARSPTARLLSGISALGRVPRRCEHVARV